MAAIRVRNEGYENVDDEEMMERDLDGLLAKLEHAGFKKKSDRDDKVILFNEAKNLRCIVYFGDFAYELNIGDPQVVK